MRIALFTPYLYPFHLDMYEIIKGLRTIQDTILFTTGIYGNYPFERLLEKTKLLNSITALGQRVLTIGACFRFIEFKPHVVILFGIESIPGITLFIISRLLRAKTIVIVEENNVTCLKTPNKFSSFLQTIKRSLVKRIYANADVLVAESRASIQYVTQILNVKRHKPIYVRPHGISLQRFLSWNFLEPKVAKEIIVKEVKLPKDIVDKVWISFIGEPSYYKGADVLLDAIELLREIYPRDDYIFLFPRNLPLLRDRRDLRRQYFDKLIKLIRNDLIITYPKLQSELMPIFYRASDVIVLPSRLLYDTSSDRSPNVAIEALASGKIIIASYVGGIPDILGEIGTYVKPNDFRGLAMRIMETLENIQNFSQYETLAINRAKEYLDVRSYTLFLLSLLVSNGH